MAKESYADLVAAFKAKGGQVTVVPEDASNGMSHKDWKYALRGESGPAESARQREERAERESENYVQRVREENGYYKS